MPLGMKRQAPSLPTTLPAQINAPPTAGGLYPTTVTSAILSTQFNLEDGAPLRTSTIGVSVMTLSPSGPESITSAAALTTTIAPSTVRSSITVVQTAPPSQTSSTPSKGIPLSTLIPAIVAPVVVIALIAPVILYFSLTRHDRQRSRSQMNSNISPSPYPESKAEFRTPNFRYSSSVTEASKATQVMDFDLGPAIDKPLPLVNVNIAPDNAYERPNSFMFGRGVESSIGQAVSRYSVGGDSFIHAVNVANSGTSIQGLSEENMRIARLANDSKASFGARELDDVSDVSAAEGRASRNDVRRGIEELSDVSSVYEDQTAASSDRGGGILGNAQARLR